VAAAALNKEQYHSVIRDMVRPAVDSHVRYFPDPDQTGKGYMAIQVTPLADVDRWAIVKRMLADDSRLIEAMGVPIRDSVQTRWLSANAM
jgi:hypothetical protein